LFKQKQTFLQNIIRFDLFNLVNTFKMCYNKKYAILAKIAYFLRFIRSYLSVIFILLAAFTTKKITHAMIIKFSTLLKKLP
jgi:hypothetical protein